MTTKSNVYNIDDYSIEELLHLFDIETINELNHDYIETQSIKLLQTMDKYDENAILFISKARDKLHSFIDDNERSIEIGEIPEELKTQDHILTEQREKSELLFKCANDQLKTITDKPDKCLPEKEELHAMDIHELMWNITGKEPNNEKINQITPSTYDRVINIDTRFRDNYNETPSNDFYVDLQNEFHNVLSMEVVSIEVPNNIYQIIDGNNTFTITETLADNSTQQYPISLIPGNYGGSGDFMTYMSTTFNIQFRDTYNGEIGYSFVDGSFNLFGKLDAQTGLIEPSDARVVFYINDNTGKTELYANTASSKLNLEFNVSPTNPYRDIGYLLGYTDKIYVNQNKHISEKIFQINGLTYFYLAIDDFTHHSIRTITNNYKNSNISQNILSRFPMVARKFGGNLDEKQFSGSVGRKRKYNGPVNIKRLRISLIDEFGNYLDIKNGDWFISILFRTQYQKIDG